MFGTDCPFDKERGELVIRDTIAAIDSLDITDSERAKLFCENAQKLLRLKQADRNAAESAVR